MYGNEKPEAGMYPVSGNTRNQIVAACVRHITPDEAKQAITIYAKESDVVLTI